MDSVDKLIIGSVFYGMLIGAPFGIWQNSISAGFTAGTIVFAYLMVNANANGR